MSSQFSALTAKLKEIFDKKTWHEYNLNDEKSFPKSSDSEVVLVKAETKDSIDYIFKLNEKGHPFIAVLLLLNKPVTGPLNPATCL